jgi:hypothetical protein
MTDLEDAGISDSDEWPPPLVFDVAYGCAVVKTWGLAEFVHFLQRRTKDIYYNGGDGNGGNKGNRRTDEGIKKAMRETREHNERVARRGWQEVAVSQRTLKILLLLTLSWGCG